jgi:transposase
MDAREWRLFLVPDTGDSVVLSREKARELLERMERMEAEIERLKKVEAEFRDYKKRHPETVGVKHGKAYALRTPAEPRPAGGKPGARPGHVPRLRPRPDHIDRRVPLRLERCPNCHGPHLSEVQETRTRLVEDLPEPRVDVTEYTIERRYCRDCRKLVESPVPGVLPGAQLGLRAMHAIVQMRVQHRMTVEQIPPLLQSLYGLKVSEGEVHAVLAQMAEAYTPVYEGFREAMRTAPAKYLDETPWWLNGTAAYLWVAATAREVIYRIDPSRGHEVALGLLGPSPKGAMVHDRFSAYETVARKTNLAQQLCWFHLLGDSKELEEFLGEEGREIHGVMKAVYRAAKRVAGRGTAEEVEQLWEALEGGLRNRKGFSSRGERFVNEVLSQRGWLFEFVVNPEVEGTNNRAERALRPMVVSRKIFGGNRSGRGARVFEVLASIVQTLRLRGQDLLQHGPGHLGLARFG